MLKKYITESDLCTRWDINKYDLIDIVIHGKLRPFYEDLSSLIIYDSGSAIELPDGSFATSPKPVTADEVTGCIYLISDVEEFEKKNRITPHELPTDLSNEKPMSEPRGSVVYEEATKHPPQNPNPVNFFMLEGDFWQVGYEGEKKTVRDLDGMRYITLLLEKPGKSISCRELYRAVSGKTPDKIMSEGAALGEGLNIGSSKQGISDRKANQIYWKEYQKLQGDLDNTEDNPEGDMVRREIEEKMATLLPHLTARNFGDPDEKKAQINIKKRLNKAYEAIGKAGMKELSEHLRNHIKPDNAYGFAYTDSLAWGIDLG